METFKIYLCGGMGKFGKNEFDKANKWRIQCKHCLENFESKYKAYVTNPNDYFNFKDSPPRYKSEREVMNFDIRRVKDSKLIIVNFNDMYSLGTMAELAIAYDRGIDIIGLDENSQNLHPWQIEMCNRIFSDINEMIEYVKNFYLT